MNRDQADKLAVLADRLGSTPRRVLLAAARMADQGQADAHHHLQAIRLAGTQRNAPADECADLLLTSPASYAHVGLTSALRALWKVAP